MKDDGAANISVYLFLGQYRIEYQRQILVVNFIGLICQSEYAARRNHLWWSLIQVMGDARRASLLRRILPLSGLVLFDFSVQFIGYEFVFTDVKLTQVADPDKRNPLLKIFVTSDLYAFPDCDQIPQPPPPPR